MGVDFGVDWAADFDNAIRFYVRCPANSTILLTSPAKGHPPPAATLKFRSDDKYTNMGVDFGMNTFGAHIQYYLSLSLKLHR